MTSGFSRSSYSTWKETVNEIVEDPNDDDEVYIDAMIVKDQAISTIAQWTVYIYSGDWGFHCKLELCNNRGTVEASFEKGLPDPGARHIVHLNGEIQWGKVFNQRRAEGC